MAAEQVAVTPGAGSMLGPKAEQGVAEQGVAKKSVAAVVVTYNRKDLLLECLDCLSRQDLAGLAAGYELQVIVVDNASTDGTEQALAPLVEQGSIAYYNTGENLGGAGTPWPCG